MLSIGKMLICVNHWIDQAENAAECYCKTIKCNQKY